MAFSRKVILDLPSKSLLDTAFLKAELSRTTGIEPERQILTYKGFELKSGIPPVPTLNWSHRSMCLYFKLN
jgi:hypothetical protein